MLEQFPHIIKTLEENKEVLAEKFKKGKRLHLVADLLGNAFKPLSPGRAIKAGDPDQAKKISEFYNILDEFDRKYLFMGAMPDRFAKFYTTYLNKLKEIQKQLTTTSTG